MKAAGYALKAAAGPRFSCLQLEGSRLSPHESHKMSVPQAESPGPGPRLGPRSAGSRSLMIPVPEPGPASLIGFIAAAAAALSNPDSERPG